MNEKIFTVDEAFRKVKSHLLYTIAENEDKSDSFRTILGISEEQRQQCLKSSLELFKNCMFNESVKKTDVISFLLEHSDSLAMFSLLMTTHFEAIIGMMRKNTPLTQLMQMLTKLTKE